MKTILCYGDSNTYGYNPQGGLRYDAKTRWTCILQDLLGPDYDVIDEGCNGRTTVCDDPVEGWKCGLDYLRPCLNSHKPVDLVILMLGSNDLKSHFGLSAAQIADNAGILVDVIQGFTLEKQGFAPEILLVAPPLIGPAIETSPFNNSFDATAITRSKQFAAEYARVASAKNCRFFDAAPVAEISPLDSVHLTAKGHLQLAEAFTKDVKKIL